VEVCVFPQADRKLRACCQWITKLTFGLPLRSERKSPTNLVALWPKYTEDKICMSYHSLKLRVFLIYTCMFRHRGNQWRRQDFERGSFSLKSRIFTVNFKDFFAQSCQLPYKSVPNEMNMACPL
jgi:hypothetical protein